MDRLWDSGSGRLVGLMKLSVAWASRIGRERQGSSAELSDRWDRLSRVERGGNCSKRPESSAKIIRSGTRWYQGVWG